MVRLFRLIPALVWAATIFWLSSQPTLPDATSLFWGEDKLLHMGAYALLTWLLLWAEQPQKKSHAYYLAMASLLYGMSDEIHQHFVPPRQASLWDVCADGLGGWIAAVLWLVTHGQIGNNTRS